MTRSRRRLLLVGLCGLGLSTAAVLTLSALNDNLVFFLTPSELEKKPLPPGRSFRIGGLVAPGSVVHTERDGRPLVRFAITDGTATVKASFSGVLPDLFREGQGVVALGSMRPDGTFRASEVLARHDETYMPKSVEEALKKSGQWNPNAGPPPPASTWNTLVPKPAAKGG
jgi:cytochrome c-type biogenesis protein CcmE